MKNKLRIWRVVPTSKTGVQAPYFFVETTEEKLEKAESSALKMAEEMAKSLTRFDHWEIRMTKESLRKDEFGRYYRYHQ
jgi:hypothetical protein